MTPQQDLLRACARGDPIDPIAFRKVAQGIISWDAAVAAADYHGLTPMLAATVAGACPDVAPPAVYRRLSAALRDSTLRDLFFSAKLTAVLSALRAGGVQALPLKGPVLSGLLYPDSGLRPFSDLDILVRPADLTNALAILRGKEYEMGPHLAHLPVPTLLRWSSEVVLYHPLGVHLDLHWGLTVRSDPFYFDSEVLWGSAYSGTFQGEAVSSIPLENLLLFLCVHGTKHLWMRLIWLADIARLLPKIQAWKNVLELASRSRCERPLLLGLWLAHDLLGANVPESLLFRARSEPTVVRAAGQVKLRFERTSPLDPTSLELTLFISRLAESNWDKVRHWTALLRAPTEAEFQVVSLPTPLFFLYYPVRAVRLAVKYLSPLVRRSRLGSNGSSSLTENNSNRVE